MSGSRWLRVVIAHGLGVLGSCTGGEIDTRRDLGVEDAGLPDRREDVAHGLDAELDLGRDAAPHLDASEPRDADDPLAGWRQLTPRFPEIGDAVPIAHPTQRQRVMLRFADTEGVVFVEWDGAAFGRTTEIPGNPPGFRFAGGGFSPDGTAAFFFTNPSAPDGARHWLARRLDGRTWDWRVLPEGMFFPIGEPTDLAVAPGSAPTVFAYSRQAIYDVEENLDAIYWSGSIFQPPTGELLGWIAFPPDGRAEFVTTLAPTGVLHACTIAAGTIRCSPLAAAGFPPGEVGVNGAFHPDGTLFVTSRGAELSYHRSLDRGLSFEPVPLPPMIAGATLVVSSMTSSMLAAYGPLRAGGRRVLYVSRDGGTRWTELPLPSVGIDDLNATFDAAGDLIISRNFMLFVRTP